MGVEVQCNFQKDGDQVKRSYLHVQFTFPSPEYPAEHLQE